MSHLVIKFVKEITIFADCQVPMIVDVWVPPIFNMLSKPIASF